MKTLKTHSFIAMIFWLITEPDNLLVVMPLTRATCSQLCLNTLSRWLPLTFVTMVTLCHILSLVCSNSPLLPMSHSLVCSLTETERLVTVPLRPSPPAPGHRDQEAGTQLWLTPWPAICWFYFTWMRSRYTSVTHLFTSIVLSGH